MKADPAGVFATNDHRRVLGHLGVPGDERVYTDTQLFERMIPDVDSDFAESGEVTELLADLEAHGFAAQTDGAWSMTEAGLKVLTGPPAAIPQQPSTAEIN